MSRNQPRSSPRSTILSSINYLCSTSQHKVADVRQSSGGTGALITYKGREGGDLCISELIHDHSLQEDDEVNGGIPEDDNQRGPSGYDRFSTEC
jgi:hypothetical protein